MKYVFIFDYSENSRFLVSISPLRNERRLPKDFKFTFTPKIVHNQEIELSIAKLTNVVAEDFRLAFVKVLRTVKPDRPNISKDKK